MTGAHASLCWEREWPESGRRQFFSQVGIQRTGLLLYKVCIFLDVFGVISLISWGGVLGVIMFVLVDVAMKSFN